jgi:hypothetical protein
VIAAPPRLVVLTVGGEFDPTPELRVAAAPWTGLLSVEVIPSGAEPADLQAALIVVDGSSDLSAAARTALDTARAASVRVIAGITDAARNAPITITAVTSSSVMARRHGDEKNRGLCRTIVDSPTAHEIAHPFGGALSRSGLPGVTLAA